MHARFKLLITILTLLASLVGCQTTNIEPIPGNTIGIVLMHGMGGTQKNVRGLAGRLKSAGILVKTPLMPWSRNRIFDKSYEESMDEIDAYVADLKMSGAKRIIVGGHSMGANAALGYAARRENLDGVILLAYGFVPDFPRSAGKLAPSVDKAESMIKAGNGESSATFTSIYDPVHGTANDIFSWFDPDGGAAMRYNARLVQPTTPILCIDGLYDRRKKCGRISVLLTGINSRSRFTKVKANHLETPNSSVHEVVEWLRKL